MQADQPPISPDALPGGGLGYALNQAANVWRSELADALASVSVTPPQFFVLASLLHAHSRGRPAPMQRDLVEATGMDANTTSQVLRGLERRKLVRRDRHPTDSRAVALGLTEEGLALAKTSTREARAVNRRFFAGTDVPQLFGVLNQVTAASRRRRGR